MTYRLDVFKLSFMNFSTWLDAEKGRARSVARHFKRSPGAITQWRNGVPPRLMLRVRDFTGGEVTLEEMLSERTKAAESVQA